VGRTKQFLFGYDPITDERHGSEIPSFFRRLAMQRAIEKEILDLESGLGGPVSAVTRMDGKGESSW
jgi:hypothetical protein